MRLRVRRFSLISALLVLLAACSGGDDAKSDLPPLLQTSDRGLVELIGGKERVIVGADAGYYILDPAISPDGKRIAYIAQQPATTLPDGSIDFGSDLFVVDRNGSNPREVLHHGSIGEFIRTPSWLPDNETLIFSVSGRGTENRPDLRIESLHMGKNTRTRLIERGVEPALAPDGHTVAFVRTDELAGRETLSLADLDTGQARLLLPANSPQRLISSIVFSPDGSQVAFAAADPSVALQDTPSGTYAAHPTLQDIWVVRRDGSDLRRLADIGESQASIAWSPDTKSLLVLGSGGFWRIDLASGERELVGRGINFGQIRLLNN